LGIQALQWEVPAFCLVLLRAARPAFFDGVYRTPMENHCPDRKSEGVFLLLLLLPVFYADSKNFVCWVFNFNLMDREAPSGSRISKAEGE
jgi:hypothetical protein